MLSLLRTLQLSLNALCMTVIALMVGPGSCPSSVTAPLTWASLAVFAGACLLAVTCARQHMCALACVDSAGRQLGDAEVQVLVAELLHAARGARGGGRRGAPPGVPDVVQTGQDVAPRWGGDEEEEAVGVPALAVANAQEDSSDGGDHLNVRRLLHLDVVHLSVRLRVGRMFCIYAATQTAVALLGRAIGAYMVPPAVRQTLGPECVLHDADRARSEYALTLGACFAISFGFNIIFEVANALQESYDIIMAFEQIRTPLLDADDERDDGVHESDAVGGGEEQLQQGYESRDEEDGLVRARPDDRRDGGAAPVPREAADEIDRGYDAEDEEVEDDSGYTAEAPALHESSSVHLPWSAA